MMYAGVKHAKASRGEGDRRIRILLRFGIEEGTVLSSQNANSFHLA